MKHSCGRFMVAFALFLSACATKTIDKNSRAWIDFKNSDAFQREKPTYYSRLGERSFCWNIGLDDFLKANAQKPISKCIYPASKLVVEKENGSNILKQNFRQLLVLNVGKEGFVVRSPTYNNDQVIFVHKTDETDLIDGSALDESQNFKMYEYVGTHTYPTLIGPKTVYSFRKVNKELGEARKDLKHYEPLREFLIENQLWNSLGEVPKN